MTAASRLLNTIHNQLARSRAAVAVARKLRNQCDRIIQCHLGPSTRLASNGELALIRSTDSRATTIFDVGANVGAWSRAVRAHNSHANIHLFECNPMLVDHLSAAFSDDDAAHVHDVALGEQAQLKRFSWHLNHSELGSLVAPRDSADYPNQLHVQVRTLDEVCRSLDIDRIDLLKVDTEGYDFHVLRGATDMITNERVDLIQFEYGSAWARAGSTLLNCLDWLAERNYSTYLLTTDGCKTYDYDEWGEFFGYSNFVACASSLRIAHNGMPTPALGQRNS